MNKKISIILFLLIVLFFFVLIFQYNKSKSITIKPVTKPLIENDLKYVLIEKDDFYYGKPGAPVSIIEFNDLKCDECRVAHEKIFEFVKANPNQTILNLKLTDFSSLLHKTDKEAQKMAYCAGKQGRFWDFVNALLNKEGTSKITSSLNPVQFEACMQANETEAKIGREYDTQNILDIKEFTLLINNKKVNVPDGDYNKLGEILNSVLTNRSDF